VVLGRYAHGTWPYHVPVPVPYPHPGIIDIASF
jgi:hypothetical protein